MVVTIRAIIEEATQRLAGSSGSARLDAEVLLCEAAGLTKLDIISRSNRSVPPEALERFAAFIERRAAGEPIAYVIGHKEFFGLELTTTPAVLIPRPDTETLVETAIDLADEMKDPVRIVDLGTGSGCIAIALAASLQRDGRSCELVAVDRSAQALAVARQNAEAYGLQSVIEFREGNWFSALRTGETFDLVCSNPPYVREGEPGTSPELRYEPPQALYADDGGLSDVTQLLERVDTFLTARGTFLCEIGAGQSEELRKRASRGVLTGVASAESITFVKDLAGHERVLVKKPGL